MPARTPSSRYELVRLGNPVLRKKAKRVPLSFLATQEFKHLHTALMRIMRTADGVGLAAPQIDVSLRIAVIETRPTETRPSLTQKGPVLMVNPRILSCSERMSTDWEGCLSFKPLRGRVRRPHSVVVEYWNEHGERIEERTSGLWARIVQHEIDHLDGIVYVDRMDDMKSLMLLDEFKERIVRS